MLLNQVLYDYFSASRVSKPFTCNKVKVDLDYLNSEDFPRSYQTAGRTIFELGTVFWLDPNSSKSHDRLLRKSVKKRRRRFIVSSLENLTGFFIHKSGLAKIDPYSKALFNLAPLLKAFELKNLDKQMNFKVYQLYLREGLTPLQICIRLGITRKRFDKIIRKLSSKTCNPINSFTRISLSSNDILLAKSSLIMSLFKRSSFRMKGLGQQLEILQVRSPDMDNVSLKQYTEFVCSKLGFRYRKFKRTYKDPDRNRILKTRKTVAYFLGKMLFRDCHVIFFDSSSLSDTGYKKYTWTLNNIGEPSSNHPKVHGSTHLLCATSTSRIINYWIVKSVNQVTTASFLYETIRYCRNVLGFSKILVLMDSATIHKTILMKRLAFELKVYFLINPPYSSKINQVEYVFELIKRPFRLRNGKIRGKGLAKVLRDRLIDLQGISLTRQTVRFYKYLIEAILKNKFWTKFE